MYGMAPEPMRANRLPSSPTRNVWILNRLGGNSGAGVRSACSQYAASAASPIISKATTTAC